MTFRAMLDVAHALWAEEVGRAALDQWLRDLDRPPDEGMAAQARLDAMLGR